MTEKQKQMIDKLYADKPQTFETGVMDAITQMGFAAIQFQFTELPKGQWRCVMHVRPFNDEELTAMGKV